MVIGTLSPRRMRAVRIVSVAVLVGTLLVPATSALATGSNASCLGHEASAVSPPGSSEEIPDGMPGLKAFISQTFPGVPPGVVYSSIAKLRLGSHEACDEALE